MWFYQLLKISSNSIIILGLIVDNIFNVNLY